MPKLNARMDRVLASVSLGRAAREKVQIKVRQPLSRIWIFDLDGTEPGLGRRAALADRARS